MLNNRTEGLNRLLIDGGPGRTVFDRAFNPFPGTANSGDGITFTETSGTAFPVTATYRDLIALTNQPPVGDLFRTLDIAFTGAGGVPTGGRFTFQADSDNASTNIQLVVIPEPATLAVFGALVAGAFGLRRRVKAPAA